MLVLYEFGLSPLAQKVKIALREKSVPFDRRNGFTGEGAEVKQRLDDFKALMGVVRTGSARRQMRDHRLDWLLRAGGAPILEARIAAQKSKSSQVRTPVVNSSRKGSFLRMSYAIIAR